MTHMFNEEGERLYYCLKCLDAGWVHPCKTDGSVDYSHVRKCDCQVPEEKQTEMAIERSK